MNNDQITEMQPSMAQAFEETSELSPLAIGALKAFQQEKEERTKPFKYVPTGRQATPNMLAMLQRRINNKWHRA